MIRHAEAEGNLYRVAHGHYDSLITDRGYEQIKALEKRFADIHIDAVYSSDLFRTRTTAKAIYVPKGLPLHTDADLREVNLGVWEDRPWQELTMESPEQMYFFNRRLEQWQIDGCETAAQVLASSLRCIVFPGKMTAKPLPCSVTALPCALFWARCRDCAPISWVTRRTATTRRCPYWKPTAIPFA